MNKCRLLANLSILILVLWSCEEAFVPEGVDKTPEIVVEGYIEAGGRPSPPYVIITHDVPFFSQFNANELDGIFVHNANVQVSNGADTVVLTELCLEDLSPEEKELASNFFGVQLNNIAYNFCIYTDLTFSMEGEIGKTYELIIDVEGHNLNAMTHIPAHVPLDSIAFEEPAGSLNDTLAQMICEIEDPAGIANYYRYLVDVDGNGYITPFASVTDDQIFDGDSAFFPLSRPEPRGSDEIDLETFGLYRLGDTISLKWMNVDEAQYRFWYTLEYSINNQGPFSNYTRVDSNIEGGLGIWGGISATYYDLIVEK